MRWPTVGWRAATSSKATSHCPFVELNWRLGASFFLGQHEMTAEEFRKGVRIDVTR